ncbi:hypothetical protein P171DRAFT_287683 [Karstenula rhodostoma CBS 690.94]|uniref:Acid phosphatase-like protein n=1 Tax=Karstenula rhodostoma CBS 690.94 TaxID=1392251 RepID=A0A9P4PJC9_9PLEO|nr:hypothetical protein P171DRAFT_287683 [Karstenula rhodostoma CBS 690.94]
MNGGWVFLIILLLALVGGYGGWVAYSRIRASRLGLPPPSLNPFNHSGDASANYPGPAPTGIKGWIDTQIRKFKNRNNRTADGAYEESGGGYNSSRGRGAGHRLDPDEAWDARVGNEAYYEEQELGLHEPPTNARTGLQSSNPFESQPYGAPSPGFQEPERGRSRNRDYDERSDGGLGARQNPFGDDNVASLRGVSPRPLDQHIDTSYGGASAAQQKKKGSADNSPTESRRSVFHEEM